MRLPNDWKTARGVEGGTRPIGGFVCKIVNAKCEEYNGAEKLVLALDIAEGENKGYYQKLYEESKKTKSDAAWPCKYGQFFLKKDGSTNPFAKQIINSIEKSNTGYNFADNDGNEKTLIGKLVGVIFGEEEWIGNDGNVHTSVKPQMFRSIETIRKGDYVIPDKKKLENQPIRPLGFAQMQEVQDDDLPF